MCHRPTARAACEVRGSAQASELVDLEQGLFSSELASTKVGLRQFSQACLGNAVIDGVSLGLLVKEPPCDASGELAAPVQSRRGCRCLQSSCLSFQLPQSRERSANSLHARDVSFGPIPSSVGLTATNFRRGGDGLMQRGSRSVSRTAQAAPVEKDPKHSGWPASRTPA